MNDGGKEAMQPVRRWLPVAALVPLAIAGCALRPAAPAFVADLPASIPETTPAIAIVGDLQLTSAIVRHVRRREDNREPQRRLIDDLIARSGEYGALAIVGDLVYSAGSGRDWRHFDSLVEPLAAQMPVLPAIGNHDYYCIFFQLCWQSVVPRRYRARFPWVEPGVPYLVPWGRLALVFLDSETALPRQGDWLRGELGARQAEFDAAIVLFHRPPFSNSIDRGAHGDEAVRQFIVPVLAAAPVPAIVFNGHIHGYEHLLIDGSHYFTTAGGGGPRGPLGARRPNDVYAGRDCGTGPAGTVLRPLNYVVVRRAGAAVHVDVHGLCRDDPAVTLLETVEIPLGGSPRTR